MRQIIFIGDFFIEDFLGGAEINDDTLIQELIKEDMLYEKIHSHKVTEEYLNKHSDKLFVLTNCVRLKPDLTPVLALMDYVIYEHDYKFVKNRNPALYPNFKVPKSEIINYNFYANAKSVVCLSKMHRDIFEKNIDIDNITNINCSLFDDKKLN